MKLTAATLAAKNACKDQIARFRWLFGESVEVTRKLAVKHAADWDWDWAAENLLTAPVRAAYDKARASAWAEAYCDGEAK